MTQENLSPNGSTWPAFSGHFDTHPLYIDLGPFIAPGLLPPPKVKSTDSLTRSWRWHQERRRTLECALRKLARKDIAGKSDIVGYLRDQYRRQLRPSTLRQSLSVITSFVEFIHKGGKDQLEAIGSEDVEGWIEHEQDRGLKVSTVKMRLGFLKAFLRFLVERDVICAQVLSKRMIIKVADALPRAMDPDDVIRLISVIDHVRDRAMVLVLLRTGMRIGELLNRLMEDVNLKERRIEIHEAGKTGVGRVVYLSEDALRALQAWFKRRHTQKSYVFYAQGRHTMSYPSARAMFHKYLDKAGLSHKGYTLHCLRHTCASELLNAGMRLECVQQLLGHSNIEMTRRYARLTDKTREEEYFRAMKIIERGGIDGHYQLDRELQAFLKETQLLPSHD
jgi:integrase/recombinase XerD